MKGDMEKIFKRFEKDFGGQVSGDRYMSDILKEVLEAEKTEDVTATSDQLMELLKKLPENIEQYAREVSICEILCSSIMENQQSQSNKRRLL